MKHDATAFVGCSQNQVRAIGFGGRETKWLVYNTKFGRELSLFVNCQNYQITNTHNVTIIGRSVLKVVDFKILTK